MISIPVVRGITVDNRQRYILLGVVGILLFCMAVAVRGVSRESYWHDEVWSVKYAGGAQYGPASLIDTLQRVSSQAGFERSPPFYYVILNIWIRLGGSSEFSTRVLSIFAGLVAVAWVFRAGWDFAANVEIRQRFAMAISAAVALGASGYFIEYMQEVRTYAFLMLLVGMNLVLYRRLVRLPHKPRLAIQIALLFGFAAMLWMHFTAIIFFLALGLYHLVFERCSAQFARIIVLAGLSLIPLILWSPFLLSATQSTQSAYLPNALSPIGIIHDLLLSFSSDSTALFVFLLALALLVRGRDSRALWFIAVISLFGAMVLNHFTGFVIIIRYMNFLLPVLALVTGLGFSILAKHKVPLLPVLAIWMVAGVSASVDFTQTRLPSNLRMNWIDMVDRMTPHIEPNDVILFHSPLWPWQQIDEFNHYMSAFPNRRSLTEDIPGLQANNEYFNNATHYLGSASRVWLGVDMTMPPNFRLAEMQRAMSTSYTPCYTALNTRLTKLDLYAAKIGNNNSAVARFGDGIDLALNEKLPMLVKGTLSVLIGTHLADTVPRGTYSIGLHLDDASGKLATNKDFGLPDDPDNCQTTDIDISSLHDGTYTLYGVVYDWRTTKRLPVTLAPGSDSASTGPIDRVLLGAITIQH